MLVTHDPNRTATGPAWRGMQSQAPLLFRSPKERAWYFMQFLQMIRIGFCEIRADGRAVRDNDPIQEGSQAKLEFRLDSVTPHRGA